MDIRVLKYYLAIVQEGSITRAAGKLHITQPTLSRQISDLEAELGVKLLIRSKRRIELTEHGQMLRRRAQEIVELSDRTVQEVGSCDTVEGTIHIGAGESKASAFLAEWIRRFHEQYPAVSFQMITGNADDIQEKLDQGTLDIGIMLLPFSLERYSSFTIHAEERTGLLMRADDPLARHEVISMKDLENRTVSMISRSTADLQNSFLNQLPDSAEILYRHDLIGNTAFEIIQSGSLAFTCEGSVQNYDPSRLVWKPIAEAGTYDAAAVWKKTSFLPAALSRFTALGNEMALSWRWQP